LQQTINSRLTGKEHKLISSLLKITTEVMFQCGYCDKVCYSETALQQHKTALSHGICKICGKNFKNGKSLEQHKRSTYHFTAADWNELNSKYLESEEHNKIIESEISMLRRVELELSSRLSKTVSNIESVISLLRRVELDLSSRLSKTVSNLNTCETRIEIIAHVGAECKKFKDVLEWDRKTRKSEICQSFVSAVSSIMTEVDCEVLAFKTTELYNKCLFWRLETCVDAATGQRLGHLVSKLVKEFLLSV